MRLWYSLRRGDGEGVQANYVVPVETTAAGFGGRRWWFTCPLLVRGVTCGRRAGKLYLPPGQNYFGCRQCHGLTYRSCQESGKGRRLFRLMAGPGEDPNELRRAFNRVARLSRKS